MQITPSEDPIISATIDSISNVVHGPQHGISRPDLAAYLPPPSGDISRTPSSRCSLPAALTALCTALLNYDTRLRKDIDFETCLTSYSNDELSDPYPY